MSSTRFQTHAQLLQSVVSAAVLRSSGLDSYTLVEIHCSLGLQFHLWPVTALGGSFRNCGALEAWSEGQKSCLKCVGVVQLVRTAAVFTQETAGSSPAAPARISDHSLRSVEERIAIMCSSRMGRSLPEPQSCREEGCVGIVRWRDKQNHALAPWLLNSAARSSTISRTGSMASATSRAVRRGGPNSRAPPSVEPIKLSQRPAGASAAATWPANRVDHFRGRTPSRPENVGDSVLRTSGDSPIGATDQWPAPVQSNRVVSARRRAASTNWQGFRRARSGHYFLGFRKGLVRTFAGADSQTVNWRN